MKTAPLVALVALVLAAPALAQPTVEVVPTCVVADDAQRMILVRALERLDQLIVETGCRDTITLTEEVDGERVILRLANATSKRKLTIAATDDRAINYARMAKSLLDPEPEPAPVVTPIEEYPTETPAISTPSSLPQVDEVPSAEEVPMRSAFYGMLGVGTGMALTLGYRTGHRTKLDLAWQIIGDEGRGAQMTTVAMRAQLLRVSKPDARSTFYAGGGLSFASTERLMSDSSSPSAQEGGVRLESTLGFELGRTKSRVFYLEAAGALPLYNVGDDYPITFVLSAGAGM